MPVLALVSFLDQYGEHFPPLSGRFSSPGFVENVRALAVRLPYSMPWNRQNSAHFLQPTYSVYAGSALLDQPVAASAILPRRGP